MINIFKNIKSSGLSEDLLDFIQSNPTRIKLTPFIQKYLTYNDDILASNQDNDIIYKTIFINSLLTSILQGKKSYEHLIPQIKKYMFNCKLEDKWFSNIEKYIIETKYDIYQKPLHGTIINGIIDLYSSETKTITDIKCSYTEFIPSQYVIQLLYYYNLAKEIGLDVSNSLKLYLPLTGIEITYTFDEI